MGLVVDSDVLILAERHRSAANLSRYAEHGEAYIDVLNAATAMRHGHAVLTRNGKDFRKLQGVTVIDYIAPSEV